jgi:hypothetical protein
MSERKTATIGLIDTRTETPGILGALIGAYPNMEAAFAANAAFQSQQRTHVRTKMVTLKESPPVGASVEPKHLPSEGEHLELSQ